MPADSADQLEMLKNSEWNDLDPIFKAHASELHEHIFSQLKPIALNSITLDGDLFCDYIKNLLE